MRKRERPRQQSGRQRNPEVERIAKPDVAFEFVEKPFSPKAILPAVRKVLAPMTPDQLN